MPAGKYTVYSQLSDYPSATTTFEIKPDKTTTGKIELIKGARIVFKLKETVNDPFPGNPWVGYKITDARTGKPVLRDYKGFYPAGTLTFSGESPRQQSVTVPPGDYVVELVLRAQGSSYSFKSDENLWSKKLKLKLVKGKDAVIIVGK